MNIINLLTRPDKKTIFLRSSILSFTACISFVPLISYLLGIPTPTILTLLCLAPGFIIVVKASDDIEMNLPSWAKVLPYLALVLGGLIITFLSANSFIFFAAMSLCLSCFFLVPATGGWIGFLKESKRKERNRMQALWLKNAECATQINDLRAHENMLQDWVRELDPDTLHEIATNWNWDAGTDLLVEILRHPDCDRGTAMTVYALAEPSYYERASISIDESDEGYVVLNTVMRGFENGQYQSGQFALDPDFTLFKLKAYREEKRASDDPIIWDLPDRAFESLAGKTPKPKYELKYGEAFMIAFDDWSDEQKR